jgi:hypothetical protein
MQTVDIDYSCLHLPEITVLACLVVSISTNFYSHPETANVVDATPGVRIVITRAWVKFLAWQNATMLDPVACFIRGCDITAAFIREFINGSGDTVLGLGSLVAKHFDFAASHIEFADSTFQLQAILFFAKKLFAIDHGLIPVALDCGIVRVLKAKSTLGT